MTDLPFSEAARYFTIIRRRNPILDNSESKEVDLYYSFASAKRRTLFSLKLPDAIIF